jgi:hypothetical protein
MNWKITPTVVISGVGGWVAYRLYARKKLKERLEEEGFSKLVDLAALSPIDLNLPSLDQIVESAVPLWDSTHPRDALLDISENGRESKYWPDTHRKVVNALVEEQVFSLIRVKI